MMLKEFLINLIVITIGFVLLIILAPIFIINVAAIAVILLSIIIVAILLKLAYNVLQKLDNKNNKGDNNG